MGEINLPDGWVKAVVGDYLYLKNGFAFKSNNYVTAHENTVPIIRISDLDGKVSSDINALHVKKGIAGFEVKNGDLLIAMSGATTGKLGIYRGTEPAYQNQRVGNLKLHSKRYGCNRFKNYLISAFSKQILKIAYGGAQPNISGTAIEEMEISLPPLAEQKIIADKLDTMLPQVENTKDRLERIPQLLKRFRQSVLAAAVSGRLSEEWRSGDNPEQNFKKLGDAGVQIITGPFGSALHKSDYVNGGIPIINPMHISEGSIAPSESMTITQEKYASLQAWHLLKGDVVIGRRGEMGRAAVVTKEEPQLCGTGSMILRVGPHAMPKYLEIILRSPTAVSYFNSASVGSTMVNLNQKVIKNLNVYFPSLSEQTEIVRRVSQLFAHADRIERQANNALARVSNLTQSILAKAFRGELTEDWRKENTKLTSGENSAESLLEKINAERATQPPQKRTKKK